MDSINGSLKAIPDVPLFSREIFSVFSGSRLFESLKDSAVKKAAAAL